MNQYFFYPTGFCEYMDRKMVELETDLQKLPNILFINFLLGKVSGSSIVIVYDETYAKDFKLPFPSKNAERSYEWENSSKYELMYVETLKDLVNVTYNHMNSNKTIFSFISSFHVIEESLQNHYAFSESLEHLVSCHFLFFTLVLYLYYSLLDC